MTLQRLTAYVLFRGCFELFGWPILFAHDVFSYLGAKTLCRVYSFLTRLAQETMSGHPHPSFIWAPLSKTLYKAQGFCILLYIPKNSHQPLLISAKALFQILSTIGRGISTLKTIQTCMCFVSISKTSV